WELAIIAGKTMPNGSDDARIDSILREDRVFPPPADFAERIGGAHVGSLDEYRRTYRRSLNDPEGFWGDVARELHWFRPWERVVDGGFPDARWFDGGTTNLCWNSVDRHVEAGHGDDIGLVWEGEPSLDG